jgi:hypothetical protein
MDLVDVIFGVLMCVGMDCAEFFFMRTTKGPPSIYYPGSDEIAGWMNECMVPLYSRKCLEVSAIRLILIEAFL